MRRSARGEIDYLKRPGIAQIGSLAVHSLVQSQGIGSLLIEVTEDRARARGCSSTVVGIEEDNPRAERLYQRLVYAVVGSEPDEWEELSPDGTVETHRAMCTLLSKPLE